jgi:hypothetical protein
MIRISTVFLASAALLTCAACGDETSGQGGSSPSDDGGSSAGAGPVCYDVDVNTGDGDSACGPNVCSPGTYCLGAGICDPGCQNTAECPTGEYCDMSTATTTGIGLCKSPGADHEVPCGNSAGSCDDRCAAKASDCGAPDDIASQGCDYICQTASNDQVDCLEETSCADLSAAFEQGQSFCGIDLPAD